MMQTQLSTAATPSSAQQPHQDLEGLVNAAYDKAKNWGNAGLALQVILFFLSMAAVFEPRFAPKAPWLAVLLALITVWVTARAGKFKGLAETIKRQHEYAAGFGRPPSARHLADYRVSLPDNLAPELDSLLREGITYSSKQPPGPTRVLENLSESAWFSKHLAGDCATYLCGTFVISAVIAISLLLLASTDLGGTAFGVAMAKIVATTLLFLISVGTLRSWFNYDRFSRKASDIDAEAGRLLAGGAPDAGEAQRLFSEYQLARASAPLIPTWVWRFRRDRLNRIWNARITSE